MNQLLPQIENFEEASVQQLSMVRGDRRSWIWSWNSGFKLILTKSFILDGAPLNGVGYWTTTKYAEFIIIRNNWYAPFIISAFVIFQQLKKALREWKMLQKLVKKVKNWSKEERFAEIKLSFGKNNKSSPSKSLEHHFAANFFHN